MLRLFPFRPRLAHVIERSDAASNGLGAGMAELAGGARRRFLAVVDIDHFKQVNDRFGHLYGDEILIHFARLLRRGFRDGNLVYRFGGEDGAVYFAKRNGRNRVCEYEALVADGSLVAPTPEAGGEATLFR